MKDQLKMSGPQTLQDSPNAISSRELGDGPSLSETQAGKTQDLCGPEVVLANLSATQARELELLTSGTYGQVGSTSSESADLASCLGNRLKLRLTTDGSTLFNLTWKVKVTPLGRSVFRLVASGRRTSDSDCGSWPTPESLNSEGYQIANGVKYLRLGAVAKLTSWPTPRCADANNANNANNVIEARILKGRATVAELATWAAPATRDWKDTGNLETSMTRKDGKSRMDCVPRQAFGVTPNGSTVETVKSGQLNPAHSRWLMGYPSEWDKSSPLFQEWYETQARIEQGVSEPMGTQ